MARFVVLVIDSFGVGAMKMSRWCVRKMRERIPVVILSQLPHLQLPTLEKLG